MNFRNRLKEDRPILFDGGFGSELFKRGIELTNSTLANELHPDDVVDIHSSYIEAGSEAIETNTFVASFLHLEMAGKDPGDSEKIASLAATHAKEAVDRSGQKVYVAGSIGPSPGAIEADAGDTDFGIADVKVEEAHKRVIGALAEGGVDFFCLETMFSAKEAALAANIARKTGLPIAINLTYKFTRDRRTGETVYKTDWGSTPRSLLTELASGEMSEGEDLLSYVQLLGLNCGAEVDRVEHTGMGYAIEGTRQLKRALEDGGVNGIRSMAYPNAGAPRFDRSTGQTMYDQTPEQMSAAVAELLDAGSFLIGGCCGTGPDHIRAFRAAIDQPKAV